MSDAIQQSQSAPHCSQRLVSPLFRIGLLLGIAIHLAGFLIFRVTSNPLPDREEVGPFVEYVSAGSLAIDRELEEQAELFDSAPLFIPTRWNASHRTTYDLGDALQAAFSDFEPDVDLLGELEPSSFLLTQELLVDEPLDLLATRYWRFFSEITQSAAPVPVFPDNIPVAMVTVAGQGTAPALSLPVKLEYQTTTSVARPVVYYMRITLYGAVLSAPTLGQSSGNVDFDAAVAKWLRRPEVAGQLPKGYLSIKVYPW
ncbi:MAG: hypothetical protein P8M62_03615 [Opitutae bacterium]|nr:hypothetical protein [Opitutae bacterium]